jgi:hypothetical protein
MVKILMWAMLAYFVIMSPERAAMILRTVVSSVHTFLSALA